MWERQAIKKKPHIITRHKGRKTREKGRIVWFHLPEIWDLLQQHKSLKCNVEVHQVHYFVKGPNLFNHAVFFGCILQRKMKILTIRFFSPTIKTDKKCQVHRLTSSITVTLWTLHLSWGRFWLNRSFKHCRGWITKKKESNKVAYPTT